MPYNSKLRKKDKDLADQMGRVKFSLIKKKGKHKRAKINSSDK